MLPLKVLHFSIEIAPFEGRAHVRGELRKDLFSTHCPSPMVRL